jgi:hypothetical protein
MLKSTSNMTTHLRNTAQPLNTISVKYRTLLGQYRRNRKESHKMDWHIIKNYKEARKSVPDPGPQGPEGDFWPINLDLFGTDILNSGGIKVLESLSSLEAGTLAALVEINRINLLRLDQKLFLRRSLVFLVAAIGFSVPVLKEIPPDKLRFAAPFVIDILSHAFVFKFWM